jgi:hypothetical protein
MKTIRNDGNQKSNTLNHITIQFLSVSHGENVETKPDPSQEIILISKPKNLEISIACEPEDGPAQARRTPAKQPINSGA